VFTLRLAFECENLFKNTQDQYIFRVENNRKFACKNKLVITNGLRIGAELLVAIFLEVPLAIVQWAHLTRLEPARDAVKVERVIAHAPCHCAFLVRGRLLIRLTLDAQIHNVIATDCTIVDDNVPRP